MKLNEKLYVIEKMTKLIKQEITGNANEFVQKIRYIKKPVVCLN
jgi:hypothetical protein